MASSAIATYDTLDRTNLPQGESPVRQRGHRGLAHRWTAAFAFQPFERAHSNLDRLFETRALVTWEGVAGFCQRC